MRTQLDWCSLAEAGREAVYSLMQPFGDGVGSVSPGGLQSQDQTLRAPFCTLNPRILLANKWIHWAVLHVLSPTGRMSAITCVGCATRELALRLGAARTQESSRSTTGLEDVWKKVQEGGCLDRGNLEGDTRRGIWGDYRESSISGGGGAVAARGREWAGREAGLCRLLAV